MTVICQIPEARRNLNNLKVSGARKPKAMNRVPKSALATHPYEENMSFNNNVII